MRATADVRTGGGEATFLFSTAHCYSYRTKNVEQKPPNRSMFNPNVNNTHYLQQLRTIVASWQSSV